MHPNANKADIGCFRSIEQSRLGNAQGPGPNPIRASCFQCRPKSLVIAQEPLNPRFTNWDPDPVQQNIQLNEIGIEFPPVGIRKSSSRNDAGNM